MWRGGALHGARIAYETWGRSTSARDNAILLFTGLSPAGARRLLARKTRPRAGGRAWSAPGCAIDSDALLRHLRQFSRQLFRLDRPGLPRSGDGQPYRLSFPDLSVEDIARGGYETMRSLRHRAARHRHGPLARRHGGARVRGAVSRRGARGCCCISGTAAAAPFAIALRSIQREAITNDPAWKDGQYAPRRRRSPDSAWRASLARSPTARRRSGQQRFGREPRSGPTWRSGDAVCLRVRGTGLPRVAGAASSSNVFDANCYLYISRAMDRFELGKHGEPVALFRRAQLDAALVIGVQSDLLFSVTEQQGVGAALERGWRTTRFAPLPLHRGARCVPGGP